MIGIRPLIICSAVAALLACSEGSKVKTVQPDRPVNFKLENAPAQSNPGDLVEATHMVSLSQDQVAGKLGKVLSAFKTDAKNGVHLYRVKYQTQTPSTPAAPAKAIIASGLMIVPDSKLASYPWISVQHGTITSQADAPTATPGEGLFEASQGFVTLAMDYIGYGSSAMEFHPYIISQAYANAGVDFLKAAYQYSAINKIGQGPLFLKGYSEGGYATLALQKAIEQNHPEFPLLASAPSAGPYDMDKVGRELMARDELNQVNIPFVILSYSRWLSNNDFNLSAVFNPPAADVQKLFSGSMNNEFIMSKLSKDTKVLLNPTLVDDFNSATPQLNEGVKLHTYLQSQSLTKGWQPKKKTVFFHCVDDETIPVSSSIDAEAAFKAPNVSLVKISSPTNGPAYSHITCPAIFAPTLFFMDMLRNLSDQ